MTSPNTQALSVVNMLTNNAQAIMGVVNNMDLIDQLWVDQTTATYVSKMSTVTINADGTLGPQDQTPVSTNPIVTLAHPLSSLQINQIKSILDAIVSLVNGNAVSAQGGARAILNAAVGG